MRAFERASAIERSPASGYSPSMWNTPPVPNLLVPDRRGSGAFKWDLAAPDEIPMWVADMDYAVAPSITEALKRRIDHPVYGYTGTPDSYREALSKWLEKRHAWTVAPDHVVTVPSVMPAIAVAIEMLTRPGDRIVTLSPVYFPFFHVIERLGRTLVRVSLAVEETDRGPEHRLNLEELERALEGAALFLLCSPHNPGGRVWTADELNSLSRVLERADVPVVADEIHADLTYSDTSFIPWLTIGDKAKRSGVDGRRADISLIAPSKTFNIPGLPLATAIIPNQQVRKRFIEALDARMLRLPNLLALVAGEAAYRHAHDWLDEVRGAIEGNYATLCRILEDERGVRTYAQQGTFIVWLDLRDRIGTSDGSAAGFGKLARSHGVWLSPGRDFGPEGEGHMRINIATSYALLREGVSRLQRALAEFAP